MEIIPVIWDTFKSKPYPMSHAKCLISFTIWKLNDQHKDIIKNFPKKDCEIIWKICELKLLKSNTDEIKRLNIEVVLKMISLFFCKDLISLNTNFNHYPLFGKND